MMIKSLDLFAGVGGLRLGLEKTLKKLGLEHKCVLYSEINKDCQKTYEKNFDPTKLIEDIKSVKDVSLQIPNHDILLAGFPCQPFSQAGVAVRNSLKRKHGFEDKDQGNLFFHILKILKKKRPKMFLLENVQNLVSHNKGKTMTKFRKVNRDVTLLLARLAAKSGIKRFVFLSSIKVNGENTRPGKPFTPDDVNIPDDPYGLSKYEAEQGLLALAKETEMEVVIIRPPLVYGPGVKGNFYSIKFYLCNSM